MGQETSYEQVLRSAFNNMIRGVWTAMPCVVVAVDQDLAEQRVDVKPLVNQASRNGDFSEQPTVYAVPVVFPASKSSAFTFPVAVGDVMCCVFSMRGLEAFKSSEGKPLDPLDFSNYSAKDAIAIPGLFPFKLAVNNPAARTLPHSTADAVVTHNIGTDNECEMRLLENGNVKVTSPTNVTVECDTANVNAATSVQVDTVDAVVNATGSVEVTTPTMTLNGNMIINGNLDVTGASTLSSTVTSGGVNISDDHDHVGSPTAPTGGVSPTGPPN